MSTLVSVAIAVGLVVFTSALGARETQRRREMWKRVADRLNLDLAPRSLRISGTRGGHRVEVEAVTGKNAHTVFMVHGVPQHLLVRGESIGSALGKLVSGEDIATGDERFDATAFVRSATGRDADVRALLAAGVRDAILKLLAIGGVIEHGHLHVRKAGFVDGITLEETIDELIDVASAIKKRARMSPGSALADVVTDDPSPRVRQRALETLIERFPNDAPFVQRACRIAATSDPSAHTRLKAALVLGKDGLPTLRKLFRSDAASEVRALALAPRVELTDGSERREVLEAALSDPADLVRAHAAKALARKPDAAFVGALAHSVRDPSLTDECIAWHAEALAAAGVPEAEGPLLALLEKELVAVRVASAKALARIGSRVAVEKLLPLTQGLTRDSSVKAAAREAIAAIQSRLAGAEAGQLAIAESPDAGALSEPVASGALSLPRKQPT